jgi:hypothetical protein
MDGHLDNNEFEVFIRDKADQHRLYPNEKVWDHIHTRLHTRKKWVAGAMLLLLISAGLVTWVMFETNESKTAVASNVPATKPVNKPTRTKDKIQINKQRNVLYSFLNNTDAAINSSSTADASAEQHAAISNESSLEIEQPASELLEETSPIIASTPAENNQSNNTSNTFATAKKLLAEKKNRSLLISGINKINITTAAIGPISEMPTSAEVKSYANKSKQRNKKISRQQFQFYFTPTISYRGLKEDVQFIETARANMALAPAPTMSTTDISKVVKHKPDLGIQVGFLNRVPISKQVSFLFGLQFNMNKYDIKAYSYPSEVTTIAYSNLYGYPSSISTITTYRSTGGYSSNWLRNYYLSASSPIGLEFKIAGTKNNFWGIAGTIQPTYVLGNRAYVISTDYQNYAQVPYLTRKWNLSTGIETFAQFKAGKTTMKIGPQFRYQTLSSFKKGYPVEEHLFDFGVKMGVILGK